MVKLIDLSQTIIDAMPVHPYDDQVSLIQDKILEIDHYNNSKLVAGMHVGTHIDLPRHLLQRDETIDEWPLEQFTGNGCLLDVCGESVIQMKDSYRKLVKEGDIVFLYTGFDKEYGNKAYYTDHPVVDNRLAEFFVERKVKMVGMDTPSPDAFPFDIHKILLNKDILIIENLTNLKALVGVKQFEVMAFPLKIKAEASLVRVVAKVE